ncbi:hypothetical protein F4779DRAFT_618107 [Xylariaceae sp. FL0662B]|nr:hypothetical protein F4779DRAFT_618107 [Xylariaceae sp. FL0662B]
MARTRHHYAPFFGTEAYVWFGFVSSQEFEIKQFFYQFALNKSAVLIMSVNHLDMRSAGETSALLYRITRPGAFVEDEIPLMEKLSSFYSRHAREQRSMQK